MDLDKNFQYFFNLSTDRLKIFLELTPEERLQWLEDAHEFVSAIVSYEKLKKWKLYIKEETWKRQDLN
ncbi:MAG: hypothetical protein QMD43_06630 [Thermodesulfovibrio sp.]|uniref:hypothetical protein n=1 Tax=Thermodesulfovibrio sp. N1 TaxID=1871110 RepID=UPI00083B1464|nr:hypothetical protein [Thermodesulfovibrio sp. N1]MDI6714683.1 hypothetical protein [Thermodesulfovibrio sp.]ODA44132.1 hypothetical protein THER_1158 [Thermodesulfovibrio sp. N1]